MNFIKKLQKLFCKPKDELVGVWSTSNEGGFHIVMGSKLALNSDGSGREYSWSTSYEYDFKLEWKRIDQDTIEIKYLESGEVKVIIYKIEDYSDAYDSKYDKIFEPQYLNRTNGLLQGFGGIPGELFRPKK